MIKNFKLSFILFLIKSFYDVLHPEDGKNYVYFDLTY